MGIAIIRLKWTPDQFWQATQHEYSAAIETVERINKEAKRGRGS